MAGFFDSIFGLFSKKKDPSPPPAPSIITKRFSVETISDKEYRGIQPIDRVPVSRTTDSDQTDDEYRSITVHGRSVYDPPTTRTKSSASSGMIWVGRDQSKSVQGFTIRNPMTYWSKNNYPDASCIIAGLKAEKPGNINSTPLPYSPHYSLITPAQRWKYLSWMAGGRNEDLDEIGYAFIFFYGLERRALVENQDYDAISKEVKRLLTRYPSSNSFNFYLNQLLAYSTGSHLDAMSDSDIRELFPSFDNLTDYTTKVILSWHWTNKLSVPWDLCYSLAKTSVGFTRTNIVKKSPALIKQLFRIKFLNNFPTGIPFLPEYEQFHLNYRPASPSLMMYTGYSQGSNIIEPLTATIPHLNSPSYKLLKKIWDNCIEDLKPAINKLNKTDGKITTEVYGALPDALKNEISHPEQESWRTFISTKQPIGSSIILQVSDISQQIGIEKREILTATQSKTLTSTIEDFGWTIVPDQTISGTSFKWNDTIAIIPSSKNEKKFSDKFQSAALIFEIAHGIAASDEEISEIEENYLYKFVSEQFSLNIFEIECLKGLRKVLDIQPSSLPKIGKRLSKHLSPEQKITLANYLGEIVLLDDKFVKEEQKAIKTVFKALEIDPIISDELIKKFLVGHIPDEPITVLKSRSTRKGEVIPTQVITPEFCIDKERLDRTKEDTKIVQEMLADIFDQEHEEITIETEPEVKIPVTPVKAAVRQTDIDLPFPPETIPSLDVKYLLMLLDIMKSAELSQDDFTVLAKKHNLMPRAAFDDINSWADEELGDFLLEESESCIVINYKK